MKIKRILTKIEHVIPRKKGTLLIVLFLTIFESSCKDWPRDTIMVNDEFYYIREERGFAFTDTFFDYEFYKLRKWWWDKKLGNIVVTSLVSCDTVEVFPMNSTNVIKIALTLHNERIFDSTLSLKKEFQIDIDPYEVK